MASVTRRDPTFDRAIIDKGANSEGNGAEEGIMRPTNSQVNFVQSLYTLRNSMDSVAKKAELWLIDEESTARFSQRLMSSPLSQRTVHNIKGLLCSAVYLVEEYYDHDERASIQTLLDIAKTSSKSEGVSGDKYGMGPDFYIQELKRLEIGARTATKLIGDLFERVFLSLTSTTTTQIPYQTVRTLNMVVTNLDTQLFWLG